MSGKCGEIGILQRRLQRPCACFRQLIGDDANVDAVASVCCIAYKMLLPELRKGIA